MCPIRPLVCVVATVIATPSWQHRAPDFQDFPVHRMYRGPAAPVDLASAGGARRFRTVLREGARTGPNFAGHYTVITWGCGTECQQFAIADARNGRVYLGTFSLTLGASYRLDSELFIDSPPDAWRDAFGSDASQAFSGYARADYYRWNGRGLVRIDSLAIGRNLKW